MNHLRLVTSLLSAISAPTRAFGIEGDLQHSGMLHYGPVSLLQVRNQVRVRSHSAGFNDHHCRSTLGCRHAQAIQEEQTWVMDGAIGRLSLLSNESTKPAEDSTADVANEVDGSIKKSFLPDKVTPETAQEIKESVEETVSKAVKDNISSDGKIVARSERNRSSNRSKKEIRQEAIRKYVTRGKKGENETQNNETEQVHHDKPFVKVEAHSSANVTTVQVEIESPYFIVSVYLLIFVPLLMAWAAVLHYRTQDRHYLLLLSASVCATNIGFEFATQSLSVLMHEPLAITCFQAAGMSLITGFWACGENLLHPRLGYRNLSPLVYWIPVAAAFAGYQLANHYVFSLCSLSERTVFTNLCPVLTLLLESSLPCLANPRKQTSFNIKLALCAITVGAIIFAFRYPDFDKEGIVAACFFITVMIPYRIVQRWYLMVYLDLPVTVLTCFDGAFLFTISLGLCLPNVADVFGMWFDWFRAPSILLMFSLSIMTFTANHICQMLLVRAMSATAVIVFQNMASFLVAGLGWLCFGDQIFGDALVMSGLLICLLGGVWYAVEVQAQAQVRVEVVESRDSRVFGSADSKKDSK